MRNKAAFLAKLHQGFDGLLGCVEAGRFGCFWGVLIRFGLFFCFTGHFVAHVPVRLCTQPDALDPVLLHQMSFACHFGRACGQRPGIIYFFGVPACENNPDLPPTS